MKEPLNFLQLLQSNISWNLLQAENEKLTRDNQIKTLNDEMAQLDQQIAKLGKDKKAMDDAHKATQDELAKETEKCNGLTKLKQKLESTLDEVRPVTIELRGRAKTRHYRVENPHWTR